MRQLVRLLIVIRQIVIRRPAIRKPAIRKLVMLLIVTLPPVKQLATQLYRKADASTTWQEMRVGKRQEKRQTKGLWLTWQKALHGDKGILKISVRNFFVDVSWRSILPQLRQ